MCTYLYEDRVQLVVDCTHKGATYGALGLSRKTCMVVETWDSKPEDARCWWKMELNELSASLASEYTEVASESRRRTGMRPFRNEERNEERDMSVPSVVRCVVELVSSETRTLEGSTWSDKGGDRRMASNSACGGEQLRFSGSAGTGGESGA